LFARNPAIWGNDDLRREFLELPPQKL